MSSVSSFSESARTFAPGARLLVRDEEWIVTGASKASSGGTAVSCTGVSELVRNKRAIFLTSLDDIEELRPEQTAVVHDASPRYRRSKLYLDALLRKTPPTDARLHLGHRGALNVADYQLEPALKALKEPRARLLIADAVGLGKTVEAGILLTELIRRGRGERILVVTLKSILEQFQQELWARFTIPLVRLDSVGLQRVSRSIPANHNPFHFYSRAIISVDTLKNDVKYGNFLAQSHWDVIVIDECQHVAVRSKGEAGQKSRRAKLAGLLANTCDNLILTSATPHDGRPESFASLINLLDPTAIADPSDFGPKEIEHLYVRRFKKDVADQAPGAFSERALHIEHVAASPEEDTLFAALYAADFRTINAGRARSKQDQQSLPHTGAEPKAVDHSALFRILLIKGLLSSPQALKQTLEQRLRHKALNPGVVDGVASELSEEAAHDRKLLLELCSLVDAVDTGRFAKLGRLVEHLKSIGFGSGKRGNDCRVVIFSERIATLQVLEDYLCNQFKLGKGEVAQFHGSLDDQRQQGLVKDFGSAGGKTRLLLASDAAAEGINLHHQCHHLVHFDIPWSLMTLEQRNGRIDRYGQQHTPHIEYLATVSSVQGLSDDLKVLDRLVEKENAVHANLGDVAWLLNLHNAEAEEQHVVDGVASGLAPEAIVPESPPLGQGTAEASHDGGADDFFAQMMMAAAEPEEAPPSSQLAERGVELYSDELAFLREAFAELRTEDPDLDVEFYEHLPGLRLQAPEDLKQRYERLPRELRKLGQTGQTGKGGSSDDLTLMLTTERDRVQKALDVARRDPSQWPEWELLWDQHPALEWVNDRVLAHFGRHEAPVLRLRCDPAPKGEAPGQVAFLLQGITSSKRSKPVASQWFVVRVPAKGSPPPASDGAAMQALALEPLQAFAQRVKLTGELSNPGLGFDTAALAQWRSAVVTRGRAHMDGVRAARAKELWPELKAHVDKLSAWRRRALEAEEAVRAQAAEQGRTVRSDVRRRLDERLLEVQSTFEKSKDWVSNSLSTSPEPYLRIAAVFVGPDYSPLETEVR